MDEIGKDYCNDLPGMHLFIWLVYSMLDLMQDLGD